MLRWLSNWRLRSKLIGMALLVSMVCVLLASSAFAFLEARAFAHSLRDQANVLADIVAANSAAALSFEDRDSAEDLLASLAPETSIESAMLMRVNTEGLPDFDQAPFARYDRHRRPYFALRPFADLRIGVDRLEVLRSVRQEDSTLGYVYLEMNMTALHAMMRRILTSGVVIVLLALVVAWLMSQGLQRALTRPVGELLRVAEGVRQTQQFDRRASLMTHDELGELTSAFNAMLDEVARHDAARNASEAETQRLNEELEAKVLARTADLARLNDDLGKTLSALQDTQAQLVESEKLAALGGLVAGVAHEINTPLGICVTASSYLAQSLGCFERAVQAGMRRADLDQFLNDARQSLPIMESNLGRAANLVRSFKLVAIDRSSEQPRRFAVEDYVAEIMRSLAHELRRKNVEWQLEGDTGIWMQSYPGALAQVLTNLTMNALIHGFNNRTSGRIVIVLEREGDLVRLRFEDNGSGMPDDVRTHVFEPFFTTRRGQGGSGLGLHISYNQVTQQLGGSIRCSSQEGQGTQFELRLPLIAPGAEQL